MAEDEPFTVPIEAELDLHAFAPSDIVSVVVAVLSRLIFDYAIWSRSEVRVTLRMSSPSMVTRPSVAS